MSYIIGGAVALALAGLLLRAWIWLGHNVEDPEKDL